MKVLFLMLTLSLCVNAEEIKVKKIRKDGEMQRSFVLKTNLKEKVVLDCQSFVQGLRIGERESALTFLLDPWECEELYKRVRGSLKKFQNHCIDVEDDIRADYTCR